MVSQARMHTCVLWSTKATKAKSIISHASFYLLAVVFLCGQFLV